MTSSAPNTAMTYREPWRLQFHFSPARNWINDPNGLVYFDGEYHLFYQYNPQGDRWGHIGWGHAVSRDLLHWTELGLAIPEDDTYMIFSGCIVADHHNSSGFGRDGQPPLVAIYTGAVPMQGGRQNQQLAYSHDRGRSWIKYAGNPVLDRELTHFRDPKVFWYAPEEKWVMVVALSDQKKVSLYASSDLKRWTHLSDFGPAGSAVDLWECPDLLQLPVANTDEKKWVLKIDDFAGMPGGGSGAQIFIGDFDGTRFVPTPATDTPYWLDHGRDFYAAASWANVPETDGRQLWLAWMNNHQYAQYAPTTPWRGAMSLPRSLRLEHSGTGYRLIQSPIGELADLRAESAHRQWLRLHDASIPLTDLIRGGLTLEIEVEFHAGDAEEFGLRLAVGGDQETVIGYQPATSTLFIDRRRSGEVSFHPAFTGRSTASLPLQEGKLTLHLFLDTASVEVFAHGGEIVMTEQIFPDATSDAAFLYAQRGSAVVASLTVWRLRSIWSAVATRP